MKKQIERLTITQASALLDIATTTFRARYIATGRVRPIKDSARRVFYRVRDVEALMNGVEAADVA